MAVHANASGPQLVKRTHVRVGGVWVPVKAIWAKVSGVWQQVSGLLDPVLTVGTNSGLYGYDALTPFGSLSYDTMANTLVVSSINWFPNVSGYVEFILSGNQPDVDATFASLQVGALAALTRASRSSYIFSGGRSFWRWNFNPSTYPTVGTVGVKIN